VPFLLRNLLFLSWIMNVKKLRDAITEKMPTLCGAAWPYL
jgi:hypothetical protein